MDRYFQRSLFVVLPVLVFFQAYVNIYDYDLWFHLRAGMYMFEHRSILHTDVFSYTAYGSPWVTHEWLFEVLLYLVYSVGGLGAITLCKALMFSGVFVVSALHISRAGVKGPVILVLLVLASVLSRERFLERPEIFTYLFSALFVMLLDTLVRVRPVLYWRRDRLWIFPLLMLFWANLHSGAIFVVAIMGAYAFAEFVRCYLAASNKGLTGGEGGAHSRYKTLFILFAVTFLVGFLNPNTYMVYTYPFTALSVSSHTGLNIAEYSAPLWATDKLFFLSLIGSIIVYVFQFRRLMGAHVLIFVFFSALALRFNRNIALWAIVTAPFTAIYLNGFLCDIGARLGGIKLFAPTSRLVYGVVAVVVSVMLIWPFTSQAFHGGWWGAGIREGRFPSGALEFLDKNAIQGNMYNSYEFGGYLMWSSYPKRPVYIDGRSDIYTELLMEQRRYAIVGFEGLIEKYDINYLIMGYTPSTSAYINPNPVFGSTLALVWFDDVAMIYLRRSPENKRVIERYEYRFVKPTDLELRYSDLSAPEKFFVELKRNLSDHPKSWRTRSLLNRLQVRFNEGAGRLSNGTSMPVRAID